MRIRRLELSGFKSFMDRTVLDLPDGITGIVGPNGCGKSNIVDAIRWVIGEQSAKHLRGDAMEDVICNGNAESGPLGMAEVSLLLSRDEAELAAGITEEQGEATGLPPALQQASEILVTRRYFRSGESEYLINRVPCRLRDITEFFLGTGVGTKAYAIIEQGRIEQIVNAKPAELRLFIEEAAGVTRFRARRVAAERKLARTRENLLRVQDVLRELDRQKALLERQARRAEEFHRVRDELRSLDLRVMGSRWSGWTQEVARLEAELGRMRETESALDDEIRQRLDATAEARTRRLAVERQIEELEERLTDERIAGREAATRAVELARRIEDLTNRSKAAERSVADLRSRASMVDEALVALRDGVERLRIEEEATRSAQAAAEDRLRQLDAEGPPLAAAVEQAKDAVLEALAEESRLRTLLAALVQRRSDIEGRRQRVEEEQRQLGERVAVNAREAGQVREALVRLGSTERELSTQRERAAGNLETGRRSAVAADGALEEARVALAQAKSRCASLQELQDRHEGCTRGVTAILSRPDGDAALLADVLRVPRSLERAVAVALGPRLGQPVVDGTDAAVAAVTWLGAHGGGSATVLPREAAGRVPPIVASGRRLLDEIAVAPEYWGLAEALLGRVLLANDLDEALEVWRGADRGIAVVTPNGEAIDFVGAISGGSEAPLEETLLARTRELRELGALEEVAAKGVAQCQEALAEVRAAVTSGEAALAALDEQLHGVRLERLGAEKDRERLEQEHRQLTAELEVWALEASGLAGADSEVGLEIASLERQSTEADRALGARRVDLAGRQEGLERWRAEHASAEEARIAAAVSAAACVERGRAAQGELDRQGEARQELGARIEASEGERDGTAAAAGVAEHERIAVLATQEACEKRAVDLGDQRDRGRAELAAAEAALTADDEVLQARRASRDESREERARVEMSLTERRLAIEHLLQQLAERYDLGADALQGHDDGDVAAEAPEEQAQRAERLRARLAQLGDVNPGAVRELEELSERYQFLGSQREDLERSLEDLRRTISKLVRTSEERFEETFAAANEKLASVFPKLFPGGSARLQLSVPEEGEDPGVEIVVQPAGKKLQHLGLLSGGEKALTATALVLALFLIRPTPFCLLDEVDAPLDEANIGRFNQVVREMAETCQFVLITHNRRTMEAADTLYGITMEQPGVSKVVSVRLREAA